MIIRVAIALIVGGGSIFGEVRESSDATKAESLYRKAESYIVKGRPGDALNTYESLVKRYRRVPIASEAQFKIAVLYENNHEWVSAFDAYQDFFSWFPQSSKFGEAIEGQLRIAKRMQRALEKEERSGKRSPNRKNLPDKETPSDMFRLILENGKHSEFSPLVRYHLAVAYEKEGKTLSAKRMHGTVLSNHPNHHLADDSAFQIGYIDYKGVVERGETRRSFGADMALKDFLMRFPDSVKVPEAFHCLREMRGWEAKYLAKTAAYYEKTGKPKSALVYLNRLVEEYREHVEDLAFVLDRIEALKARLPDSSEAEGDIAELP